MIFLICNEYINQNNCICILVIFDDITKGVSIDADISKYTYKKIKKKYSILIYPQKHKFYMTNPPMIFSYRNYYFMIVENLPPHEIPMRSL